MGGQDQTAGRKNSGRRNQPAATRADARARAASREERRAEKIVDSFQSSPAVGRDRRISREKHAHHRRRAEADQDRRVKTCRSERHRGNRSHGNRIFGKPKSSTGGGFGPVGTGLGATDRHIFELGAMARKGSLGADSVCCQALSRKLFILRRNFWKSKIAHRRAIRVGNFGFRESPNF